MSKVSEWAKQWAQRSTWVKWAVRSKRMSERCERTSERTSEWPSTSVFILGYSGPQCDLKTSQMLLEKDDPWLILTNQICAKKEKHRLSGLLNSGTKWRHIFKDVGFFFCPAWKFFSFNFCVISTFFIIQIWKSDEYIPRRTLRLPLIKPPHYGPE